MVVCFCTFTTKKKTKLTINVYRVIRKVKLQNIAKQLKQNLVYQLYI